MTDTSNEKRYALYWYINHKQLAMDLPASTTVTIGRSDVCDVVIAEQTISRKHASIHTGTLQLTNLSTTNPLWITQDDTPLELSTEETCTLAVGQRFMIGAVHLRLIALSDESDMVICWNCGHKLNNTLKDCPWCGITLAFGIEA